MENIEKVIENLERSGSHQAARNIRQLIERKTEFPDYEPIQTAEKILAQLVTTDGELQTPTSDMFPDDKGMFSWDALGNNTDAVSAINHITASVLSRFSIDKMRGNL